MARNRIESPTSQVEVRDGLAAAKAALHAVAETVETDPMGAYRVLTRHAWCLPIELTAVLGKFVEAHRKQERIGDPKWADAFNKRVRNAKAKWTRKLVAEVRGLVIPSKG